MDRLYAFENGRTVIRHYNLAFCCLNLMARLMSKGSRRLESKYHLIHSFRAQRRPYSITDSYARVRQLLRQGMDQSALPLAATILESRNSIGLF